MSDEDFVSLDAPEAALVVAHVHRMASVALALHELTLPPWKPRVVSAPLRLDVGCGDCGAQAGERGTPYCPGCHGILARVLDARARDER